MDDFLSFNSQPMHSANEDGDRAGRLQKIQNPGLTPWVRLCRPVGANGFIAVSSPAYAGVIDIAILRSEMQIAALYLRLLIKNVTMFPVVKKCAILSHRRVGSTARLCRPRSSGDRATVS